MKKSIKIICLIMSAAFLLLSLCSCGSTEKIDVDEAMTAITSSIEMPDEIMTIANSTDLTDYFQVDSSLVNTYTAIINPSSVGFELIILEAVDSASADEIVSQLNAYKSARIETYKSYNPDYASLLENTTINLNGVYVSMFVADNSAEILSTYNSLFD